MTPHDPGGTGSGPGEPYDPADVAAAERLDAVIAAALDGRGVPGVRDPEVELLAGGLRRDPPASTYAVVDRRLRSHRPGRPRRRWSAAQVAAAVLGAVLIAHGAGNMVAGEWISTSLGEPYNEHAMVDGGLAFIALGAAVAVAATRRRWLPVAVIVGVPLGLVMGGRGVHEVGVFAWGAVAHGAAGVAALVLLVTYSLGRRYSRRSDREGRV
ncbi:hypothetical protein [Gordonia sp. WA4-43]|uniref:hypothetical protein n=1 Tax=Gordonia sp. WA4-43 TaxID=2878678 RepID=UPI001CFAE529|nr:hypothetical protein [Gordonia sp. WA4-43]UCZ91992.1 hypothetical protein LEL84_10290 [Gordonia sp. WA4-43]